MKTHDDDTLRGCTEHALQLQMSCQCIALKAFKSKLLLKWHPDKRFGDTQSMQDFARQMLQHAISIKIPQ